MSAFVIEQDSRSRLVRLQLILRSGALADPQGLPGLAHFTGRALLRGTRRRPHLELMEALEERGAAFNILCDPCETHFHAVVLAENWEPFLELLTEILTEPAFEESELGILRGIIQGELRSAFQDPRTLASRAALSGIFPGTRLESSIWGTLDSLDRISAAEVSGFYRRHYRRDGFVVGVSGPLDPSRLQSQIEALLSALPSGQEPLIPLPAFGASGRRATVVPRREMSTTPIFMVVPGVSDADPRDQALELGNFVFGEDFTSKLMQVLRAENGWTYGAYSSYHQLLSPKKEPGLFSLYTFPSAEFGVLALEKAFRLLEEYVQKGVTDDEFQGARESLFHRRAFLTDTTEKRLSERLRSVLTGRPLSTIEEYRRSLDALTPAQVNQAIRETLSLDRLVISVVGEESALRPALEHLPGLSRIETLDVRA